MSYDPTLADPVSRVRFAVGDYGAAELEPDATYTGALAGTMPRVLAFEADPAGDRILAPGHTFRRGQAVQLVHLDGAGGLAVRAIYYIRNPEPGVAFQLASSPAGAAVAIEADGAGELGPLDELAAARVVAGGLAARFAQLPTSMSDAGSGLSYERVKLWTSIAAGDFPAGVMGMLGTGRAKGIRIRRGPFADYNTGTGDE